MLLATSQLVLVLLQGSTTVGKHGLRLDLTSAHANCADSTYTSTSKPNSDANEFYCHGRVGLSPLRPLCRVRRGFQLYGTRRRRRRYNLAYNAYSAYNACAKSKSNAIAIATAAVCHHDPHARTGI